MIITEAEQVRDILSNKFGHFQKFSNKRLGKLLAYGLASHEGEKMGKTQKDPEPSVPRGKAQGAALTVFNCAQPQACVPNY